MREIMYWYLNHEQHPEVKIQACIAVRTLKIIDAQVQETLKELLDSSHENVRAEADKSLITVGLNNLRHLNTDSEEQVKHLVRKLGTKNQIITHLKEDAL